MVRMTGRQGFYSSSSTTKLLRFFSKANIDTIYIVCIHGYYLNEYKLYKYVADNNIALVHIMIDEYAYGGKCAYNNGCNRYFGGAVTAQIRLHIQLVSFWMDQKQCLK